MVNPDSGRRRDLVRHLEGEGHACREAADAAEVTIALAEDDVALVLCDVALPDRSGLDVLREVGTHHPHAAVVLTSGSDDPELARTALTAGVDGYVVEPIRPSELLITVETALRQRSLWADYRAQRRRLEETVDARTADLRRALDELSRAHDEVRRSWIETVERLAAAAEFKDPETGEHLERMSHYSELLGHLAGLEPERCRLLRMAAPMHDVGKVGVPDSVVLKSGPYDADDREAMRSHPEIGHALLAGSGSELLETAAVVALTHHERWDGTGYPRGLSGTDIPLVGRIVAIADVFDALTTRRRYKPAMSFEEARGLMSIEAGRHFDPDLVERFFSAEQAIRSVMTRFRDPHRANPDVGGAVPAGTRTEWVR